MNSDSASLTLLVASIGVVGTLAGTLTAQIWQKNVDDQRWKRELTRERDAWRREESRRYYENEREAHFQFLRVWQRLHRELWPFAHGEQTAAPGVDLLSDLHEPYLGVHVFGTKESTRLAGACMSAMRRWAERADGSDRTSDQLAQAYEDYVQRVRLDLGVVTDSG